MYSVLTFAALVLSASAHPLRQQTARHHAVAARMAEPSGWFHDYLENYEVYHTRYLALGCHESKAKGDTKFFDACCHPMLATETLEKNRAPECKPEAKAASSAAAAEPTSTVTTEFDDELEDCEEEDDAPSSSAEQPKATQQAAKTSDAPKTTESPKAAESPKAESSKAAETPKTTETPKAAETPKTTSEKQETPTPTTVEQPKETKGEDNNNNNSGGQTFSGGRVTFYDQGGVAGACGDVHGDYDLIAAMNTAQFESLKPCGKNVLITAKTGKSVTVKIADECPGCNANSIDLSRGAFQALGSFDLGVIDMSWKFV